MKPTKKKPAAKSAEEITVHIPKEKATGGAAGAIIGGIVGGPVGAVVGGAVGASVAGNTDKVKKAIVSGAQAARKSSIGQTVVRAVSKAGHRLAGALKKVKDKIAKSSTAKKVTSTAKKVTTKAKGALASAKKAIAPKKAAPAKKASAKKTPAPKAPAKKKKPSRKAK